MNLFDQTKESKPARKHYEIVCTAYTALLILNFIVFYLKGIQLLDNRTVALFGGLGLSAYYFSKYRDLKKYGNYLSVLPFLFYSVLF